MAIKIALLDGVRAAKASSKKNIIFVDVTDDVTDEMLKAVFDGTGMEVLAIEKRKGIFG